MQLKGFDIELKGIENIQPPCQHYHYNAVTAT